jgi:secreted trypsin-like serine protease
MKNLFFVVLLFLALVVLIIVMTISSRKPLQTSTESSSETAVQTVKNYDVSKCYIRPVDKKIFGGTEAGSQYPFVGALKYKNVYLCGLTLIAPLWCLGSAHCISYLSGMTVTVGRYDLDLVDIGQVRNVVGFYPHPRFNTDTFEADIALFKLDKPIDDIKPICLPINETSDREEYLVVGWGSTENADSTTRLLQVTVYPSKDCASKSNETICATNNIIVGGPCFGDSGGPLFHLDQITNRYIIDGVVSRGSGQCVSSPSIFTKVSSFIDWILATI